jgi:aspartate/tyrosine/aromatic aminotransferase
MNWIRSAVTGLLVERPGQKLTLDQHAAQLEKSGDDLVQQFRAVADTADNRDTLCHIIGIERWGQRRLQIFLGEQGIQDEYEYYRPGDDLDRDTLVEAFQAARQETIVLVHQLAQADFDTKMTIMHNQYGKLTVYGWLHYLSMHAKLEGQRVQ